MTFQSRSCRKLPCCVGYMTFQSKSYHAAYSTWPFQDLSIRVIPNDVLRVSLPGLSELIGMMAYAPRMPHAIRSKCAAQYASALYQREGYALQELYSAPQQKSRFFSSKAYTLVLVSDDMCFSNCRIPVVHTILYYAPSNKGIILGYPSCTAWQMHSLSDAQ